jgi:hypothetical protein
MRTSKRLSLLLRLLPVCYLLGAATAAQAQASRWSDPATWPDKQLPAAGAQVTIASGQTVLLDVSPPALNGLTIFGKLAFADEADLELSTEWIMLHGELEIGTEAHAVPRTGPWLDECRADLSSRRRRCHQGR